MAIAGPDPLFPSFYAQVQSARASLTVIVRDQEFTQLPAVLQQEIFLQEQELQKIINNWPTYFGQQT